MLNHTSTLQGTKPLIHEFSYNFIKISFWKYEFEKYGVVEVF